MADNKNSSMLEEKVGWQFRDPRFLNEALTHSTFANEATDSGPDNERLEFLGDAVVDLLVATELYRRDDMVSEGEMSRRRARVVRRESLAALARDLRLDDHLLVGEGQRRCGATDSILADAYEALVGAVFLDGGYDAAASCFLPVLKEAIAKAQSRIDYKTRLQELCHLRELKAPRYQVTDVQGPGHAREYTCEVAVGEHTVGPGLGTSKKAAEQHCARMALEVLET